MRLSHVILGEILYYDPDFEKQVDKLLDQGGKHLGSGDYGSAYLLNGRVYKVTTDEIELEHAQLLKGKKTNNFKNSSGSYKSESYSSEPSFTIFNKWAKHVNEIQAKTSDNDKASNYCAK